MKYFLHDTNAFNDEKITELFMEFGYEGVGLFFTALEKIANQEKPIKTSVLKKQLYVGKKLEKCWSFMESLGILSSNNGETFNKQLLNFSEKYKIKKEKTRMRVANFRTKDEDVTHYKDVGNAPKVKESKVKKNKVKESKLNNILQTTVCDVLPELMDDKQKHIQIIGLLARAKKQIFENKEQQSSFIRRNLRPAKDLAGYEFNKIIETMQYLMENADFKWTLETVGKYINEDLSSLKKKGGVTII